MVWHRNRAGQGIRVHAGPGVCVVSLSHHGTPHHSQPFCRACCCIYSKTSCWELFPAAQSHVRLIKPRLALACHGLDTWMACCGGSGSVSQLACLEQHTAQSSLLSGAAVWNHASANFSSLWGSLQAEHNLPITSSQNGTFLASCYHNTTGQTLFFRVHTVSKPCALCSSIFSSYQQSLEAVVTSLAAPACPPGVCAVVSHRYPAARQCDQAKWA